MSAQIAQFRRKNLRADVIQGAIDAYRIAESAALGDGSGSYYQGFGFTSEGTS